jgi:hypothetical protein
MEPMSSPDPSRCPCCGQSNRCAQLDPNPDAAPCWCFEVQIDPQVLEALPAEQRDLACLCPRCAAALPPTGKA